MSREPGSAWAGPLDSRGPLAKFCGRRGRQPGAIVQAPEGQEPWAGPGPSLGALGLHFLSAVAPYPDLRGPTHPEGGGAGVHCVPGTLEKGQRLREPSLRGTLTPTLPWPHSPRPADISQAVMISLPSRKPPQGQGHGVSIKFPWKSMLRSPETMVGASDRALEPGDSGRAACGGAG